MLATMLTAMYLAVRAAEQLGVRLARCDPLPCMVAQPMPWQVHCVSQGRRGSQVDEFNGEGRSSVAGYRMGCSQLDKAATTIQTQYRKYQQRKQKERKY